ncbi:MAG: AAA family ATPase [Candidatus Aminicenantes bacterium]|nr:AAA family ATPase [Candidatus Aminicenantes bacterium]
MLITFKNAGMVEEAGIRLNGLTVIAGENDTGKSTIGKLIFSIIKTFNRYEKDALVYRMRNIEDTIEDYYSDFKRKYSNSPALADVRAIFLELKNDALKMMDTPPDKDKIRLSLDEKLKSVAEVIKTVSGIDINFANFPAQVIEFVDKKPSPEEIFKRSFGKYMNSLFNGEVANKFSENKGYSITGEEGNKTVFEITGSNGSITVRLDREFYYEDATFIESPVLLNLADLLRFSKNEFDMDIETRKKVDYLEKGYAPEYMKDFIMKLTDRKTGRTSLEIPERIRHIIQGDFYYAPEERDFVFEKGNKRFKGISIASGIKYMGAINILLLNGFISRKSLLVIDEPETHMHPQWQTRFAEVLVKLVKEGNPILLTSHSPYLIEALQLYCDKNLEKGAAAFYLADKKDGAFVSRVYDVTHDPSPIFEKLSKPFDELELLQ